PDGTAGDLDAGHLPFDLALRAVDDPGPGAGHDLPADRALPAAALHRQVAVGLPRARVPCPHSGGGPRHAAPLHKKRHRGAIMEKNRRSFLKKAGAVTGGVAATAVAAPYVKAQSPITWRLQTYAGPALAEHVIKPAVDAFNKAAN